MAQAAEAVEAGTANEAQIDAVDFAIQFEAVADGATASAASAYAAQFFPTADDVDFSNYPAEISADQMSLFSDATTGADVGAEAVDAAAADGVVAGGEAAVDSVFAGSCVATLGLTCAVGAGVALGAGIDYVLGDFSSDASTPATGGFGTSGIAGTVDWSPSAIKRVWYAQPSPCTGSWNLEIGSGSAAVGHQVSGAAGNFSGGLPGYISLSCTVSGAFMLVADVSGVVHASGGYAQNGGWVGGWYDTAGGELCDANGNLGPIFPGIGQALTLSSASYAVTPVTLGQHGWTALLAGTTTSQDTISPCNGTTNQGETIFGASVESGRALALKPSRTCPSGDTCTAIADNPTSSWTLTPSNLATQLSDPSDSDLNQYYTSIDGGTTSGGSPVGAPGTVSVPSCAALTLSACESALTAAGFTATPSTSTLPGPAQVKADGAGHVVATMPAAGAAVDPSSPLTVELNPNPLWITLPQPASAETGSAYENDLLTAGETGTLTLTKVSDANESATAGPDGAVGVFDSTTGQAVGATTLVNPTDALEVEENPDDAPEPAGVPSSGCGLTPPSASPNFSPITNSTLGGAFPFSIIPWLDSLLGTAPAGQRPDLTFSVFGAQIDATQPLGSTFDPVFADIRSALAVCLWIGAMVLLYKRITGSFE